MGLGGSLSQMICVSQDIVLIQPGFNIDLKLFIDINPPLWITPKAALNSEFCTEAKYRRHFLLDYRYQISH